MTLSGEPTPESTLAIGQHGPYHWLSATTHTLDELLHVSPAVVLGKYLAVTSCDSGPLILSENQKARGWTFRGGISYSVRIESLDMVSFQDGSSCPPYEEGYVFEALPDLGSIREGNVFEHEVTPGHVEIFVNFRFSLQRPEMHELVRRFWQQMEWVRPETYVAETDFGYLTFVTRDHDVFAAVCQAFEASS